MEPPDKSKVDSRRDFLNKSTFAAAAALAAARVASAQSEAAIRIPDLIPASLNIPAKAATFPMRGAQVFARACSEEGLAAFFCCPGNYEIINAIAEEGIPSYGGRGEGNMCAAADGFTRVTGEVAAVSGTEGPGLTNMIMNIGCAHRAHSPVLVMASNMRFADDDTEYGIQTGYQQPTTEGLKKYGKRIIDPPRVYEYAGYAFRQLKTGVPRPVHLDFSQETRAARFNSASDLKYYHDKSKYRTEVRPYPDPKQVRALADLIQKSQRPLIVAGRGVFQNRAWDTLKAVAERSDIAVVEAGASRGFFPDDHRLSITTAPAALMSADLVIFIGQYSMPSPGEWALSPDAQYARIDPDPADIGRNWPIDLAIVSDEKAALESLLAATPKVTHSAWVSEIAAAKQKFEDENANYYKIGLGYTDAVHPAVIAKGFSDFLYHGDLPKEQVTVVSGGYGIARYTRRFFRAYRPGQILNGAIQYAAIGPDIGYAVGAAAAVQLGVGPQAPYKGAPIVGVTGDAGFGYSAMELETISKYRLPVVMVVYNNNGWGVHATGRATHLYAFQENLRYDKIAEALGARGEYVTKSGDFLPALKRSYEIASKERISTVINCQAKWDYWWDSKTYPPGFLGKTEPSCMAYYH